MIRLGILITAILIAGFYLLKMEESSIINSLVCLYNAPTRTQIIDTNLERFKISLPTRFPISRFNFLTKSLRPEKLNPELLQCDQLSFNSYKEAPFHDSRMALHPLFLSTYQALGHISQVQYSTQTALAKLTVFKSELVKEKEGFSEFLNDCDRIKAFAEQILLLESHLKINKPKREPSTKVKTLESRMKQNISRQLSFARKHLSENEKLFFYKWKRFFDFDTEKNICRY